MWDEKAWVVKRKQVGFIVGVWRNIKGHLNIRDCEASLYVYWYFISHIHLCSELDFIMTTVCQKGTMR